MQKALVFDQATLQTIAAALVDLSYAATATETADIGAAVVLGEQAKEYKALHRQIMEHLSETEE